MKLPKGTIALSIALSVCILVMGAGVGASGLPPSGGNSPAGELHDGAAVADGMAIGPPHDGRWDNATAPDPAGSGGAPGSPGNVTWADFRSQREFDNATLPFNGTFPEHGNRTFMGNRSWRAYDNSTLPADDGFPGPNSTFTGNRTPMNAGHAHRLSNSSAMSGGNNSAKDAGPSEGSGTDAGKGSPIDELFRILSRFFGGS